MFKRGKFPRGISCVIKKICAKCKTVRRRGRVYVVCVVKKHKQRQG